MGCIYILNNIKVVTWWPWFTKSIINHSIRRDDVPSRGPWTHCWWSLLIINEAQLCRHGRKVMICNSVVDYHSCKLYNKIELSTPLYNVTKMNNFSKCTRKCWSENKIFFHFQPRLKMLFSICNAATLMCVTVTAWTLTLDSDRVMLPRIEPWHTLRGQQTPTRSSGNLNHFTQLSLTPPPLVSIQDPLFAQGVYSNTYRQCCIRAQPTHIYFIRTCLKSVSEIFGSLNNQRFTFKVIQVKVKDSWYKTAVTEAHYYNECVKTHKSMFCFNGVISSASINITIIDMRNGADW